MNKIIEIIISPKGETRLETKGFQGSSCQRATQFLENALGVRQSEQLTGDFYSTERIGNHLQEGQA